MAQQFVKALVLVVGVAIPAAAEQIPKYDIDSTCRKISEKTAADDPSTVHQDELAFFCKDAANALIGRDMLEKICRKGATNALIKRGMAEIFCRKDEVGAVSTLRMTVVSPQILRFCMRENRRSRWLTYFELNKCVQTRIYMERGMGKGEPVPNYDEYCDFIYKIEGAGSLEADGCREREAEALAKLRSKSVKPEIMRECTRTANLVPAQNWGYFFLGVCIKDRVALQASASLLPAYDIDAVCAKLMQQEGSKSYFLEKGCRDNETQALATLRETVIEPRILSECEAMMTAAGSSPGYFVLLGCVRNELDAKKVLGK